MCRDVVCQSKTYSIGQFRVPPGSLYQKEVKGSAFDMEMIFHSHPNKTHFHKKACGVGLILKVRVFWNSEVAYCFFAVLVDVAVVVA